MTDTVAGGRWRWQDLAWWSGVALFVIVALVRSRIDASLPLQVVQFAAAAAVVVVNVVARQPQRPPMRRIDWAVIASLGALVAAALISAPWGIEPSTSLSQWAVFALMALFLVSTLLYRWTSTLVVVRDLTFVYFGIVALHLVGLVGYVAGAEWAAGGYHRYVGLFANANFAGMLPAVVAPLAVYLHVKFSRSGRIAAWIAAALLVVVVVLSSSRGSAVAMLAGFAVAVILVVRKRWFTITAGAVLVLAGAAVVLVLSRARDAVIDTQLDPAAADFFSGRFGVYALYLEQWFTRPVLGIGFRASGAVANGVEAHNIYLSVLVEMGIVGALCFLCLIVALALSGPKRATESVIGGAAIAVAVSELSESSLFGWGSPTAVILWIIVLSWAALGRTSKSTELDRRLPEDAPRGS